MAFAAGFAFAIGMGGASTARAGLLDFIFGWRDRAHVSRPAAAAPHPEVTIRPKAKRVAKNSTKPAALALSPKEQLARTIDPVKNPRWYLEDPTLRKGDILVLADRVLVFAGGEIGRPKSYVALSRTKLLSAKERARVALITGRTAPPAAVADGAKPRKLRAASFRLRAAERG
ncbi:hypothetical protein [Hansschlegelia zhihuaiae]|uniref:Uncharacterized protein n=1 Tax=Hansschlegelia zhihuaiae TaxID=405005 RepID=A0A4Q0M6B1_9HYPH|nr:hypothetical protein [Hansschlegelia zhihuaiae]RXF68515.1 hypothetical protein EK403_19675 [Hansschlegelia zhihuaiae]